MTLRARLTGAFLAVVLGPVLAGAVFVGGTVAAVNRNRSVERLDLAASSVRTSIAALCRQLRTAAESVAVLAADGPPVGIAQRVVDQGLGSAVRLTDPTGTPVFTTPNAPDQPWAECAGPSDQRSARRLRAIVASVEMRDATGAPLGHVRVAQALDLTVLRGLAAASGASVTLLAGTAGTAGAGGALSTEGRELAPVVTAARTTLPGGTGETGDGRYVRRDGPGPDQPLPLALSVPGTQPGGLYAVLVTVVLVAALLAVVAAWWLARSTTRPLAALASAADRVAGGDLAARVPVLGPDEVGRLGAAFNRMTHETQGYVQALTASRDQLRGHLGVLGDTLSSTHDLARILQVLLQTALAATGARAGVVLLAEPAENMLVGQCGHGLTDRLSGAGDAASVRVPIGVGLLGDVAATRQARRGRVDSDGPALSPSEPRCLTYVAVPFTATTPAAAGLPAAAGVLALYDRLGRDEFDDADLVTLRTFAGQAAVAVANVRVHEEAQRLSVTDPLTGLLNYRSLTESLRREVERANRFDHQLGVLALDLDRFKAVNDSYGHSAGDAVLTECAQRLRAAVREVDLAFRRGGEEFVVLLPETDAAGAVVVAERLLRAVRSAPIVVEVNSTIAVTVTVSVGVAVYPEHGDTGPRVLAAADEALYAAKAAGRDAYRVAAAFPDSPHVPAQPAAAEPAPPGGQSTDGVANGPPPPRRSRGG